MTDRPIVDLLRCPFCVSPLGGDVHGTVRCADGHAFDANRRGYLTLFPRKRPNVRGDTAEMLAARERVLDSEPYRQLRGAVADAVADGAPEGAVLADLGCGTGQYASTSLAGLQAPATALVADLSPEAVRAAVRRVREASAAPALGVVLDLWSPLPIATGVVDRALNVFAPRNLPEFARVLAPGGRLITVIPSPSHLAELRGAGGMIDVQSGKREQVRSDAAEAGLRLHDATRVAGELPASTPLADDLVQMGPSAHHASTGRPARFAGPVTVDVELLVFTRAG
ncbi:putative RNA methyltransferase [Agromyces mangrovi Wang et al. 2018]|uniref:putative RNA methyltransferase n=1 Tax=Agromyces mangrovi TaxID=1858653 RepID=UPI0025742F58|nr:methyltransferase domain-containing protein [Agromyces mangrovi]BDZ66331.1 ubiquinone biosynthesis protein [Agromyces mangrovi]